MTFVITLICGGFLGLVAFYAVELHLDRWNEREIARLVASALDRSKELD